MAKKKTVKTKSKKWQWIVLAALVLLVLAYLGGHRAQQAAEKADADRFAALQTDFKKLQTEFNKIDPGWQYSEGCEAKGDVANPENRILCSVTIENSTLSHVTYSIDVATSRYASVTENQIRSMKNIKDSSYRNSKGADYSNRVFSRSGIENGLCEISSTYVAPYVTTSLTCNDEAQKFYFPKTDK